MAARKLRINGVTAELPTGRAVAVEPQSLRHALNGNCWVEAWPCPAGACSGVCGQCHEHGQLRAACTRCAACPYCGRSDA